MSSVILPRPFIAVFESTHHMNTSHDSGSHTDSSQASSWQDMFDDETRRELIEADREAWKAVVTVLMTIVIIGLCLGFLGAAMSVWL